MGNSEEGQPLGKEILKTQNKLRKDSEVNSLLSKGMKFHN